jgi:hypothetical protein
MSANLQAANQKRHVASMLRKHGKLVVVQNLLADEGTEMSLPAIRKIASDNGIEIAGRGRPVKCDEATQAKVTEAVKTYGLTGAKAALEAKGLVLTLPTIRKYATAGGVGALKRGRKPAELKKAA